MTPKNVRSRESRSPNSLKLRKRTTPNVRVGIRRLRVLASVRLGYTGVRAGRGLMFQMSRQ